MTFEELLLALEEHSNLISNETKIGHNTNVRVGMLGKKVAEILRKQGDTGEKYLSKIDDDTAQGIITFLKAILIGDFSPGLLGSGGAIRNINGTTVAEFDQLLIRQRAEFFSALIHQAKHIGGELVQSAAEMICIKVEETTDFYRCYFDADDGKVVNLFENTDFARHQVFTGSKQKFYWRKVVAVGPDYIELSKTNAAINSDIPEVGDYIYQLGSENTERQGAIILSTVGSDAPSIKQYVNINTYALSSENEYTVFSRMGNKIQGKTVFRSNGLNYDDWADGTSQDIQDAQEAANAAALAAQQAIDDAAANVTDYNAKFAEMQAQVDGEISNYSYPYTPTLLNYPASDWATDIEKDRHIGDVFHNSQAFVDNETTPDSGKAWRFVKNGTAYSWTPIADSDAVKAIQEASKAQAMADGKSTTFLITPTKYKLGDMWVLNADQTVNGTAYKSGEILTATQDSATYNQAHWIKRVRYTDDTAVENLKFGGRNLFILKDYTPVLSGGAYLYYITVEQGKEYTASTNIPKTLTFDSWFDSEGVEPSSSVNGVTIDTPRTIIAIADRIYVAVRNTTIVDKIKDGAYWVKVEKGNKVTDYSEAPEDTQAKIDAAVVKATYWSVKASAPVIYKDAINAATSGTHTPVTVSGELRSGTTATAGGFITVTPNGGTEDGTASTSPLVIAPANGDGKTSYTVRLYDTASKTTLLDTMTIPVVFKGASGVNAINVVLSNEADILPASTDGTVSDYSGSGTIIRIFEGATELDYDGIGAASGKFNVAVASAAITAGTRSKSGLTCVFANASNMTADNASIVFTITGKTTAGASFSLTKTQSFAKSRTGQKGADGVSITLVDVEFAKNTSPTTAPTTGWTTTAPAITGTEQLWTRTKTTYSSGSPTYSTPANITPKTGATGQGIDSVTEEYHISSSKTTQPAEGSAGWSTTQPTWSQGQYIWSRVKVVYKNPTSTVYTGYAVSSEWEAVNELVIGVRNLFILEDYNPVLSGGAYYHYINAEIGKQYTVSTNIPKNINTSFDSWFDNEGVAASSSVNGFAINNPRTITATANRIYVAVRDTTQINGIKNGAYWVKVEKGNKATDWSEAPEDTDKKISDVDAKAIEALAKANISKAITDKFGTDITGGLITTVMTLLREANSQANTAGFSGIQGSLLDQPSYWSGGTHVQAQAFVPFVKKLENEQSTTLAEYNNLPSIVFLHNGAAKIGHFIVLTSGEILIIDKNTGAIKLKFSTSDLPAIADLIAGTNSSGSTPVGAGVATNSSSQVVSGSTQITKNGATATFNGTYISINATGKVQTNGIESFAEAVLYARKDGVRLHRLATSIVDFHSEVYEEKYNEWVPIPRSFITDAGTYTFELVVHTEGLVSSASAVSSASTFSWKHVVAGVKQQQYAKDGMMFFYSNRHFYFNELTGLDVKESDSSKFNMPGVLAAGSSTSGGIQSNVWGAKASTANITPITGGFRVPLSGLSHSNYVVQITPHTNTTFRVGTKISTYFEVYGTGGFDYVVIGNNYA